MEHLDSALVSTAVSRLHKVLNKISNINTVMTDSEKSNHSHMCGTFKFDSPLVSTAVSTSPKLVKSKYSFIK